MKKKITLILFAAVAAALLVMGLMENVLSSIGGTPAVVAAYTVIGIILLVLYIRAKKASDAEKNQDEAESENKTSDK